MATGAFWNVDNPKKPWGSFDPNDILIFPIDVSALLADMGVAYASHSVITAAPLECVSSSHSNGVISVKMKLVTSPTYVEKTKYPFTLRVVGADGQQRDKTWLLKVESA